MKVFVTGAAGYIGRATVKELLANGHTVVGLTRNDANAAILEKLGAATLRGDIEDLDALKRGASGADAVIHLAYIHDFGNIVPNCVIDRAAISAMAEAIEGTGKPLVIAQGMLSLPEGVESTEDTEPAGEGIMMERPKAERLVRELSETKGIKGMSVRLPPTVHDGTEDQAFMRIFIGAAKKKGYVAICGEGAARWPTAHRSDTAALYRLAIEKGTAGAVYHAAAEVITIKDALSVIARKLDVPLKTLTPAEMNEELGLFGSATTMDRPAVAPKTRGELGWAPKDIGLLEDLETKYFDGEGGALAQKYIGTVRPEAAA